MFAVPKDWRAGRAWLCVASLFATQVGVAFVAVFLSYSIGHSLETWPAVSFLMNVTGGLLAVFVTFLFARPKTIEQFKTSFSLQKPEPKTALLLIFVGAALAATAVWLTKSGLGTPPRNHLVESFSNSGPVGTPWLRSLLIISPFAEELIMRGYLYAAFRQSYSLPTSLLGILAITALTHWSPVTSSAIAAIFLMSLNIVLCLAREKTGSLWNCILCHLAYNLVCALT